MMSGARRFVRRFSHERAGRLLAGSSLLVALLLGHLLSPWFLLPAAAGALNLALSGVTDRCAIKRALLRLGFPGERDLGREEVFDLLAKKGGQHEG